MFNTILRLSGNVNYTNQCSKGCRKATSCLKSEDKMKHFAIILFIAIYSTNGWSQDFETALSKGDVTTISQYLDKSTEICYRDEIDFYDRSQATSFLKKFYAEHKPISYKPMHKGSSKGNSHYTIGALTTDKGTYRVYLYFRKDSDQVRIQEIRFDEQG